MDDRPQQPEDIVLEKDEDDEFQPLFDRAHEAKPALGRVQARDFAYVSLVMKGIGWMLLLLGLLTSRFDSYVGYGMMGVGALFLVVGSGLAKYRIWAYYAGLVLLIVVSAIITIGVVLMLARNPAATTLLLLPAACLVLLRAMLTKDGRERYRRAAEARAKARANPESLSARALRG